MEVEVCMNVSCKNGYAREWKKGWPLRSGGFARLCHKCGSAYENLIFCQKFHLYQTGWRECSFCNKTVHCGCIVSSSMFEYLDYGGIGCATCVKTSQLNLIRDTKNTIGSVRSIKNNARNRHTEHIDGRLLVDSAGKGNLMLLRRDVEASESIRWPRAERDGIDSCIGPNRQEDRRFSNVVKLSGHSLNFTTLDHNRPTWETQTMHKSSSLNMSLGTSSGNSVQPSALDIAERRLEDKASFCPFPQGQRSLSISKSLMDGITMNLEDSKDVISQERVARLPANGKPKNLLHFRYWPRITGQELEKLSGDLKSTIVPLFEKVLSASDAGRIGRLVLPKSCAEAYFPPISQSEGLPLQFKDVKGNDWTFQFRFWPNNNSRMYVLEGVTPCIQAMQLNAGDIVTFSRIDPGGKFVMGYRRASDSMDTQDASTFAHSNGFATKEATFSGATANLHSGKSYPDLLQTRNGNGEPYLNGCSEHLRFGTGTADCLQTENCEMVNNDLLQQTISVSEKTLNIAPKSKRLLTHNEDAVELRITWEEAQDLLHPPPSTMPSVETIEDKEFEEFEEPPVFGKGTTINDPPSGSLSSASEKMSSMDLENIPVTSKDSKKRRIMEKLDSSAGATTKHPRHCSGCTCILCIQPPSGKGRHKPTCTTVRRQFKTLMKRKKQRESDATQNDQIHHSDEGDTHGASREGAIASNLENEGSLNRMDELGTGQIDLNSHPDHE
ncbi:B3 domain-containing transcription repressor VAL1 [Glycine soja]|uniref:B3 domain-containing transcription repressor VAL1 n=1 Tax=Glycine soja TaxID=3848 RepID=A0A0B2RFD0_GLYSO|nr:B3 domain-containing transcription repressor VAL1 [Glycine soja]